MKKKEWFIAFLTIKPWQFIFYFIYYSEKKIYICIDCFIAKTLRTSTRHYHVQMKGTTKSEAFKVTKSPLGCMKSMTQNSIRAKLTFNFIFFILRQQLIKSCES